MAQHPEWWWWSHHHHVVGKSPPKSHSTLRAKRAKFTFGVDKSSLKMPKIVNLRSFWKTEASGQTVLPDRSISIGQKLAEKVKIQCDILSDFQHIVNTKLKNANFWRENWIGIFAHCDVGYMPEHKCVLNFKSSGTVKRSVKVDISSGFMDVMLVFWASIWILSASI